MRKLEFRAGSEAFHLIKSGQFRPTSVRAVVAAAGGPKWFTTYGLVRYIIADFLKDVEEEIHFLGASVGSWQMAAALASDPGAAIDRLQYGYSHSRYNNKPDEAEISRVCSEIISQMLCDEVNHILAHPNRMLHVVTARGKGWLSSDQRLLKTLGFAYSFTANAAGRSKVKRVAERVVFSTAGKLPYPAEKDVLPTVQSILNGENILPALRASGSIPFMMEGIKDIPSAPRGTYWDGGITDYHIALPYDIEGIVLHPHFLPFVLPGWLDKKIPWNRKAHPSLMSKVLLVTPSESFVESLPRKQISDMKDFYYFGEDQDARIQYWNEISQRSLELGREFHDILKLDRK